MSDPTALPNFPPPADEHPLRGRVLDVLKDLGINPDIDNDGDVAFVVGEPRQQLFARCLDGDLSVLRVFGQWALGGPVPDDALERLQRANDFTLQLNVAKVGIAGGNLIVTCDHVVLPGADLSMLVQLSIDLVMQVVNAFYGSWQQGRHESGDLPGAPGDGGQ